MMVYEPETVGVPPIPYTGKQPAASSDVIKKRIAAKIRQVTDPAIAKRTIDATIVKVAVKNQKNAERLMRSIGVNFSPRSATMGGMWDSVTSWLSGSGKLSNLDKYSTSQRERLKTFLNAENFEAIEKTYTQSELDQILAKISEGAKQPAGMVPLVDPYNVATNEYKAGVVRELAPLGPVALGTGAKAGAVVGNSIVEMYRNKKSAPNRSFEWLGRAKWVLGLTLVGVTGYVAWPHIKPYVSEGSTVGQKP